jgi:hypothetical protein
LQPPSPSPAFVSASSLPAADVEAKIAPWLQTRLAAGGEESFLVLFDDAPTLEAAIAGARGRGVYDLLRRRAASSQAGAREDLKKAGIPFRSLYIVNGLAVRGHLALAQELALRGEVVKIVGDPVVRGVDFDLLAASPSAGPEWGLTTIEADKVWTLDGNRGAGDRGRVGRHRRRMEPPGSPIEIQRLGRPRGKPRLQLVRCDRRSPGAARRL